MDNWEKLNNRVVKTIYTALAKANAQPVNVSRVVQTTRERKLTQSLWESQETPKQVKKVL